MGHPEIVETLLDITVG